MPEEEAPLCGATAAPAAERSEPTRQEWDPETINRFWAYHSIRDVQDSWYFAASYGTAIVNLAHLSGALRGRVLDYGCGHGILVRKLLRRGLEVQGLEFSRAAAERVDRAFRSLPGWLGATAIDALPSPISDDSFDLVFCVEVVEHLDDDWFEATLTELFRLTRRGGHVVLTTPCNENLESSMIYCPFCSSEFHKVQHMRSISPQELRQRLEMHGFEVLLCKGLQLERFQEEIRLPPVVDLSLRSAVRYLGYAACRLLDGIWPIRRPGRALRWLARSQGPHLCALVRKR